MICKMEKKCYLHLLAIMMVAVLSVGFTSCSSDDDENNDEYSEIVQKLQGTWEYGTGTASVMESSPSYISGWEIDELGEDVGASLLNTTISFSGNIVNGTKYSIKGNQIVLSGVPEVNYRAYIKELTEDKLVLHEVFFRAGGYDCTLHYNKKE